MKTSVAQIVRAHVQSPEWEGMPTPAEVEFMAWMERTVGPAFYASGFGCYNWRVGPNRVLVTLWLERTLGTTDMMFSGNLKLYHGLGHRTEWHPVGGELARKAVLRLVNGGAS